MGAAAIPLIGGGISAIGQMNESQDRAAQLEDEAVMAQKNAKLARDAGAYNARRYEMESAQNIGSIEANYGASGLSGDSGNIMDTLRQATVNSELDRQNILRGAELQGRQFDLNSRAARYGAKQERKAGKLNVFSTLFGAGARAADRGGGGSSTSLNQKSSGVGGGPIRATNEVD